jgi:hypothetical protein
MQEAIKRLDEAMKPKATTAKEAAPAPPKQDTKAKETVSPAMPEAPKPTAAPKVENKAADTNAGYEQDLKDWINEKNPTLQRARENLKIRVRLSEQALKEEGGDRTSPFYKAALEREEWSKVEVELLELLDQEIAAQKALLKSNTPENQQAVFKAGGALERKYIDVTVDLLPSRSEQITRDYEKETGKFPTRLPYSKIMAPKFLADLKRVVLEERAFFASKSGITLGNLPDR